MTHRAVGQYYPDLRVTNLSRLFYCTDLGHGLRSYRPPTPRWSALSRLVLTCAALFRVALSLILVLKKNTRTTTLLLVSLQTLMKRSLGRCTARLARALRM